MQVLAFGARPCRVQHLKLCSERVKATVARSYHVCAHDLGHSKQEGVRCKSFLELVLSNGRMRQETRELAVSKTAIL